MSHRYVHALCSVLLALVVLVAEGRGQTCSPSWSSAFGFPGTPGISCATMFDDGSGPALYVGGSFSVIGGVNAVAVAKWNGSTWSAVGSGLYATLAGSTVGQVNSLAVYKGQLYAAGSFRRVGFANNPPSNKQAAFLAVFNGTDWEPVGVGFPDSTYAFQNELEGADFSWAQLDSLTTYDDGSGQKLYIGGNFVFVYGNSYNLIYAGGVASWDGTTFASVGNSPGYLGLAFASYNEPGASGSPSRLFMATDNTVYRWDGAFWTTVSGGIAIGAPGTLASYDGLLFAGGTSADPAYPGGGSTGLASWNGSGWSSVDIGLPANSAVYGVNALLAANLGTGSKLYISRVVNNGGVVVYPAPAGGYVVSYDGTNVHSLVTSHDLTSSASYMCDLTPALGGKSGILAIDPNLSGTDIQASFGMALWNGTQYTSVSGNNGIGIVSNTNLTYNAIVYDDTTMSPHEPQIYVANGSSAGPLPYSWVAKFNGQTWTGVGNGAPNVGEDFIALYPCDVHVFDTPSGPSLFTSSLIWDTSDNFDEFFAQLVGNTWEVVSVPQGTPRDASFGRWVVVDLAGNGVTPPTIFYLRLDLGNNQLCTLTGGSLVPVAGAPAGIRSMAAYTENGHQRLFVAGISTTQNVITGGVQRYDGETWTQVGNGLNGEVVSLYPSTAPAAVGLVAVGTFTASGSTAVNHVALWNGTSWSPLGGGFADANSTVINNASMNVWDNGTGPKLVVAGIVDSTIRPLPYVASFDGARWNPVNAVGGGFDDYHLNPAKPSALQAIPITIVYNDGGANAALYALGSFISVDGIPSQSVARFGCAELSGVCCRGAVCSTSIAQASCVASGTAGASFVTTASACNSTGVRTTPCCYADFNHSGAITVQDIFDFLTAWFAKNPYAQVGGDGVSAPTIQSIFDFIAAWFAKGC